MTSTATCTLHGHLVIIDSFRSKDDADIPNALAASRISFAAGDAWLEFLADPGVQADQTTMQMQLTDDAAGLLEQSFSHNTPAPATRHVQIVVSRQIAKALGGVLRTAH